MDENTPLSDTARLYDWRYLELRRLGLSVDNADELSQQPDVAHAAEALIIAGCTPLLAYRILRPASGSP